MRCAPTCRRCQRRLTGRNRGGICGVCWRPLPLLHKAVLSPPPGAMDGAVLSLAEMTRWYAVEVVQAHGGNLSAAARALGVSRSTLYRLVGGSHARGVTVR